MTTTSKTKRTTTTTTSRVLTVPSWRSSLATAVVEEDLIFLLFLFVDNAGPPVSPERDTMLTFAAVVAGMGLLLMGLGAVIMADGVNHAMNEYSKFVQSLKPMLESMIEAMPFGDKTDPVPDYPPKDWFKE